MQSRSTIAGMVVGAVVVASTPAHAERDTVVPRSLRMRPRQVAQALPPAPPPAEHSPDDAQRSVPSTDGTPGTPELPAVILDNDASESALDRLAESATGDEVILVTGSAIGRKTLTTPAPVTILDRELLVASGLTNLGEIIQQQPGQTNGANAGVNVAGDGSTRIDLRGFGAARTLALINGRRVVASGVGADISVDFGTIPLAIIDRVEILKDGASAIYGSDAIGGVVNVITRNDFDGNEATIYTGGTQRGDGFMYDASFVTGHNSENGKGNIVFATGLSRQMPVMAADRSFSAIDQSFDFATGMPKLNNSTASVNGLINTGAIDSNGDGLPDPVDLCGVQFCATKGNGEYRPFLPSDLYNPMTDNYLLTPSSSYHLFSTGSYRLHPQTQLFFEASYMHRQSDQQTSPETFIGIIPISKDNAYNTAHGTVFGYQRRLDELGKRTSAQEIGTFRLVGGLKGTLPADLQILGRFKWELSYDYGRSSGEQRTEGLASLSRLANALGPTFPGPNNTPICGTPFAPIPGCVPMDILGPAGSISPAAADYVRFTALATGFSEQQTVLAQTHGQLVALPHGGDISLAVGGDFRKESGALITDPFTSVGDTTGIAVAPTAGSYNVVEGFGELSLVPISGQQFPEWIEIDLAARAFRYDTFGSGVTWKVGGLFRIVNGFAIRGTYSTAFRAPAISELYRGRGAFFIPLVDPCDTKPLGATVMLSPDAAAECANQGVPPGAAFGSGQNSATQLTGGGNSKLGPETAKVATAGIVFEPPQIVGLSLTADYWRVDTTDAIQVIGPSIVLARCYERHIQSACEQIVRNPQFGYAIDHIDIPISNVGGASASGIDLAAAFNHKLGTAGRLRSQLEAQYLRSIDVDDSVQIVHGAGNYDFGANPRLKASLSTLWQHPSGVGAGITARYVGQFRECDQGTCSAGSPARVAQAWYKIDAFLSESFKTIGGTTSLTIGVDNLLDRNPPALYTSVFGDYDPTAYDFRGRFFYARMSQMF